VRYIDLRGEVIDDKVIGDWFWGWVDDELDILRST
jgi:hypothetical protein